MLSTVCTTLTLLLASGPGQCVPPVAPPVGPPSVALTFEISTAGSMVVVNYQGIQGTAARMSITPNQDAIVLEGQVQIRYQAVHISAERVIIRLSTGGIEVSPAPAPPPGVCPVASPPACTTGSMTIIPFTHMGLLAH
jgi:hypothetical protein